MNVTTHSVFLLNLKQHKQGIQLCYGTSDPVALWNYIPILHFSLPSIPWMSRSNLFAIKLLKFTITFSGRGYKSKIWCKGYPIYLYFSFEQSLVNLCKKSLLPISIVSRPEHLLVSSSTLSCKTKCFNFFNVMIKIYSFCLILNDVSHELLCPVYYQGFTWFCGSILTSSFWNFVVSCYSLIWLLSDIVSSEGLSRYGTSTFRYSWLISRFC